eukprot:CAMPEP_0171499604 /NCGR_PEP_ID=MMETSP0958-20121227/8524_1 /TAXON_ID=87120 /ORGANISM="Aurantiochytrium limacinum, Strain ATCCMYA-1381" /LENGTH=123 /DNA_ID=CAMNT_0012034185 /DNA_START=274 /DNA_END=648 /DNA_ORIENTATION=+
MKLTSRSVEIDEALSRNQNIGASAHQIYTPHEKDEELRLPGLEKGSPSSMRKLKRGPFRKRRGTPVPVDLSELRSQLNTRPAAPMRRAGPKALNLPSVMENDNFVSQQLVESDGYTDDEDESL